VMDRLRAAMVRAGGEKALGHFYAASLNGSILSQDQSLLPVLVNALSTFGWLRDAYVARPDPLGEVWRAARVQADR